MNQMKIVNSNLIAFSVFINLCSTSVMAKTDRNISVSSLFRVGRFPVNPLTNESNDDHKFEPNSLSVFTNLCSTLVMAKQIKIHLSLRYFEWVDFP